MMLVSQHHTIHSNGIYRKSTEHCTQVSGWVFFVSFNEHLHPISVTLLLKRQRFNKVIITFNCSIYHSDIIWVRERCLFKTAALFTWAFRYGYFYTCVTLSLLTVHHHGYGELFLPASKVESEEKHKHVGDLCWIWCGEKWKGLDLGNVRGEEVRKIRGNVSSQLLRETMMLMSLSLSLFFHPCILLTLNYPFSSFHLSTYKLVSRHRLLYLTLFLFIPHIIPPSPSILSLSRCFIEMKYAQTSVINSP